MPRSPSRFRWRAHQSSSHPPSLKQRAESSMPKLSCCERQRWVKNHVNIPNRKVVSFSFFVCFYIGVYFSSLQFFLCVSRCFVGVFRVFCVCVSGNFRCCSCVCFSCLFCVFECVWAVGCREPVHICLFHHWRCIKSWLLDFVVILFFWFDCLIMEYRKTTSCTWGGSQVSRLLKSMYIWELFILRRNLHVEYMVMGRKWVPKAQNTPVWYIKNTTCRPKRLRRNSAYRVAWGLLGWSQVATELSSCS